jgi:ribulose kinase
VDSTQESVLSQAVNPVATSAVDAKASTRRSTDVLSVVEQVVQARLSERVALLG